MPEPTRILGWVFAYKNSRYHCFLNVALKRLSQWAADWKERTPHASRAKVWVDPKCRPKEFALFPSCKTKRRLVSYTWSQLKELLLIPLKRAVEVCGDKKGALVKDLKQQMEDLHGASEDEQVRLMDSFFDWRKLKGKWKTRSDWHVCSFATDGMKLCITFATGRAPAVTNVPCLVKAGYQIPTPDQPVDAMQVDRGLYHVREDNVQRVLRKVASDAKMRITAIDPGVIKPIEAASVEITGKQTWTTENVAKAALESVRRITEAEWKRGSDRSFLEEKEQMLRQRNAEYDAAIRALGGEDADGVVAKRTVDAGSLRRHMAAWFTHLPALRQVLLGESRCKIHWVHERKETSYIDTVCDAIMERSTLRVRHEKKRRRCARQAPGAASRALEDVHRCVDERRTVYAKNRGAKHVVFMGDGTFSHSNGHISIPKKRLVKALAHRGMCVLVQEAYTSKRCPCGTADLKTTSQSSHGRFRCHETPGPDRCCVCDEIGEEQMDRDFLAVVNLLYIAFCVLRGCQWPPWLAKNDGAPT